MPNSAWGLNQAKEEQKTPAVRNVTDPGSRLMPVRGGGFIQGYNAQHVTSSDGLLIATRLTHDTTDTCWYEPMISDAIAGRAEGAGIGLVLAGAGKHRDLEKRGGVAAAFSRS